MSRLRPEHTQTTLVKKKLTNAERCKAYRVKIAQDPVRQMKVHEDDKARAKRNRDKKKTEEQIQHERYLQRLRQKKYDEKRRQQKKAELTSGGPTRPQTRLDVDRSEKKTEAKRLDADRSEKKREANRLAVQKHRQNQSAQKRRHVNEKRMSRYYRKKEAKAALQAKPPAQNTPVVRDAPYPDQESFKRAARRVKAKIKVKDCTDVAMETGVGPPSENMFGMVEASGTMAVAQIKQEAGETEQTLADTNAFHQTFSPTATHSNDTSSGSQSMFSAYSVSLGSEAGRNFSADALSLPVHFDHHQPGDSSHMQTNGSSSVPPHVSVEISGDNSGPSAVNSDGHSLYQTGDPSLNSSSHEHGEDTSVSESVKVTRTRTRGAGRRVTQNHVGKSSAVSRKSDPANIAAPSVKQKKVAKVHGERMERTTRCLRARQSAQLQHNSDDQQLKASGEPASAQPEEIVLSQPPARELRTRRMTRKPNHTQRVWRLSIFGDAMDKWHHIGDSKGLSSDTEIAVFLMEHYENVLSGEPTGAVCVTCHSALTFTCLVCHTRSQLLDTSVGSLTPQQSSHHSEENHRHRSEQSGHHHSNGVVVTSAPESADCICSIGEEIVTKLEPEEAASDGDTGAEPSEDIPEKEEKCQEEERKKKGKRKRGRPVGSGKRQVVSVVPIKPNKLKLRKYRCTYEGCEAAFSKSSRLKIHVRIHTGEKPYVCKECDRAFTQNSGLKVHMQKHTGLRPYSCAECGSCFPSSSTLKQHMRRHTGEKPFHCKKCDKTFRWSGHLTQHMRMHDGIKPFLCPDCGKSFSASSDLVKHKVTHTKDRPYKCDLCDKAYSFQHRLTAHQRSHTGDRPFLCSLCGSAFARAHNLTVHYRTHTGDKPYWCKDCGAKFSDSGNFSKHKKTKHGPTSKAVSSKNTLTSVAEEEEQEDAPALAGNNDNNSSNINTTTTVTDSSSSDLSLLRLPDFGQVANMAKMAEFVQREGGGKLPSMANMAGLGDDEDSFLTVGGLRSGGGGVAMTTISRPHSLPTVSSSSPNQHLFPRTSSPPCEMADLKNLLPPLEVHDNDQTLPVTALPPHLSASSSHLPVDSPPLRLSGSSSSAPSPNPIKVSPGPSGGCDSQSSPVPQAGHQTQEYRISETDGVVFPPQYYPGSYPYYYQQQ